MEFEENRLSTFKLWLKGGKQKFEKEQWPLLLATISSRDTTPGPSSSQIEVPRKILLDLLQKIKGNCHGT